MIETIIAAMIMLTVFPLVFIQYADIKDRQNIDALLSTLENVLFRAQMTAMAEDQFTTVQFNNRLHQLEIQKEGKVIEQIPFDPSIRFVIGSHQLSLRFSPTGTIGKAGTIFLQTDRHQYKITFLLGHGRFYAEEV